MRELREGLEERVDVTLCLNPAFDCWQIREIIDGIKSGVDASIYAKVEFNNYQMRKIRIGLESGVDVNRYLNPNLDAWKMERILMLLKRGIDPDLYIKPEYSSDLSDMIANCVISGRDYSVLIKPCYNDGQRTEIYYGMINDIDYKIYENPKYSVQIMECIRYCLMEGVNVLSYIRDGYNIGQCKEICRAINSGISLDKILNKNYSYKVMKEIIDLEKEGINTTKYFEQGFNINQLKIYIDATKEHRFPDEKEDYSRWFKPEYPRYKMKKIRKQLKICDEIHDYFDYDFDSETESVLNSNYYRGIDLLKYAKLGFEGIRLEEIGLAIRSGAKDVKPMLNFNLNYNQLKEIRFGFEHGVDVTIYSDIKNSWSTMYKIRILLENDLNPESNKIGFNEVFPNGSLEDYDSEQIDVIFWGYLKGVDFKRYLDPSIPAARMRNIYWMMENEKYGVVFNDDQLKIIAKGVEQDLPIIKYAKSEYTADQMKLIVKGLEEGLNTYNYENCEFSIDQMYLIYRCEKDGLRAIKLKNPLFTIGQMRLIYFGLLASLCVEVYASPKITEDEMKNEISRQLMEGDYSEDITFEQAIKARCVTEIFDKVPNLDEIELKFEIDNL